MEIKLALQQTIAHLSPIEQLDALRLILRPNNAQGNRYRQTTAWSMKRDIREVEGEMFEAAQELLQEAIAKLRHESEGDAGLIATEISVAS